MFLAPLFLLGLLAAAIPLVLHLRRSTRHKRIVFSTTRFFDEQFIRSSRRAQVQDKLLMALRIALLALFVLALAQPLVRLPGLAGLMGGKRNVAIVLDDSASMAIAGAEGTALDRAKRHALALLEGLSEARGDKATLALAGRREDAARLLFPEPTSDLAAVRKSIADVTTTDLATDLHAAVAKAGEALGARSRSDEAAPASGLGGSGSREVFVFSDLQASAFVPGQQLSAGAGVALIFVATAPDPQAARQNVSVDAIQYGAPQPMQNVPFTFRALVTNHGDRERSAAVSLVIDGQTVSQKQVELPPGRSKFVRFAHRFTKPGWFRGHVEVGPDHAPDDGGAGGWADAAPADNRRHFALRVDEGVKLLAINGAPSAVPLSDELFFFRVALTVNPELSGARPAAQTGAIRVEQALPAEVTADRLKPYPLVVLANVGGLAPEALEAVERYVDAGGNLLITLGDRVDPAAYNAWVGAHRLHGGLLPGRLGARIGAAEPTPAAGATIIPALAGAAPADAGFIAAIAEDHPVVAGFSDGQFGSLNAVRFTSRFALDAPPDQVILRGPGGDPLLAEKRFGRGRVMLFTSSIDRDWTNFPLQPTFVPWLYRLVGYLAQSSLEGAGFVRTGQVVQLPTSATQVEALQIELPDGGVAYPEPPRAATASGPAGMVLTDTERAGVYALRTATQGADAAPRMLFAANIPSDEADPVYLDKEAIGAMIPAELAGAWDVIDPGASAIDTAQLTGGRYGVWDVLLILALGVGLFEPWLANRLSKHRATAAPDAMSKRDVATPTAHAEVRPAA